MIPTAPAAILPSRNEPSTIASVIAAVDTALGDDRAVIVHADSSDSPDTTRAARAVRTRARLIALSGLPRGKGAQILAGATKLGAVAGPVLIADTDTRNPHPAVYGALLARVRGSVSLAIADYARWWDEANLTNHLARPLIAAATGHDVPQPLAGDLALTPAALAATAAAAQSLPDQLKPAVEGYGIDALLLLTAAALGTPTSMRFTRSKQHAASFDHLPLIYQQAAPVLLHLTAAWTTPRPWSWPALALYRPAPRPVTGSRLVTMLAALEELAPQQPNYAEATWPQPLAAAWHATRTGTPAAEAAEMLWPHYIQRVRAWLAMNRVASTDRRAARLSVAHRQLNTTLTSLGVPR